MKLQWSSFFGGSVTIIARRRLQRESLPYPQAIAYGIEARRALGERFSVKDFHNAVLGAGTLPLDMLERAVDALKRLAR